MSLIKKAASLIICSLNASSSIELQVLMLQRSSFGHYGNLCVFPGGKLESVDSAAEWDEILGKQPTSDDQLLRSNKLASLRETFEECGLLLVSKPAMAIISEKERNEWKLKIIENPQNYLNMMKALHVIPRLDTLTHFSNWISPASFDKNRFDTQFFLTTIEDKEKEQIQVDGREATRFMWYRS